MKIDRVMKGILRGHPTLDALFCRRETEITEA